MTKVAWWGQAGLLFEIDGYKFVIDPYLSNSVENQKSQNYRRVAVKESLFEIKPDIMIFTHNHLDHYDPETVSRFLKGEEGITILAPYSVWKEVRDFGEKHNYVLFNRNTEWSQCGVRFSAVRAEHNDEFAIGVIIDDGKKKYYVTGDTLYNTEIFEDIPEDIYAVFLPVNGVGNNMNMEDAARFAERIEAQKVIPLHFGMFDELDPCLFSCKNKVIPEIYREIKL